eukprot:TRINITY_DN1398_c0_g1_i1.p1 TRINITY_DN1398_c0_g1~~TRINITY_DN1398_c0_g1_i1.p1  ORF type:complete len:827 (-),score=148.02 TRINITY_DN1398_c0_g1_i1:23-2503(-)
MAPLHHELVIQAKGQTEALASPLLLQRLRTTTTIADKRDALTKLADLTAKEELQCIVSDGIPLLLSVVTDFSHDTECVRRILEVLTASTSTQTIEEEMLGILVQPAPKGALVLLGLLQQDDFYVRYPTVQLLTKLLQHRPEAAIQQILTDPNAVTSLVSVLDDPRESVRNEGLLLLKALVANDAEMQKIVSFTNAFENLFKIITDDGGIDGSIVVEDSLAVMAQLLRNDVSQRSFREMGFCRQLAPLLKVPFSHAGRRASGVANTVLQIVLMLLQGSSAKESELKATKRQICESHVFEGVLCVAFHPTMATNAQIQALKVLAVLVTDYPPCQEALLKFKQDTDQGPVSALLGLIQPLFQKDSEEHHFYAVEALRRVLASPEPQLAVVASVRPIGTGMATCGQVLTTELLAYSPTRRNNVYFASLVFAMALQGNRDAKIALLKAMWDGGSFFSSLCRYMVQMIREKADFAVASCIRVLLAWMHQCPEATIAFVEDKSVFVFTIQSAGSADDSLHVQGLCALLIGACCLDYPKGPGEEAMQNNAELFDHLVRKLGFDQFTTKWRQLCTTAEFEQHSLHGQPSMYDEQYVTFLKDLYARVDKHVQAQTSASESPLHMPSNIPAWRGDEQTHPSSNHFVQRQADEGSTLPLDNNHVSRASRNPEQDTRAMQDLDDARAQYQQKIDSLVEAAKRQDDMIAKQARELAEWRTLAEQRQQLLEGEVAKAAAGASLSEETTRTLTQQIHAYEHELQSLTQTYSLLEQMLAAKDREISHLLAERSVPPAHLNGERRDCDAPDSTELLIIIGQMDEQLQTYTTRLKTHGLLDPEPG